MRTLRHTNNVCCCRNIRSAGSFFINPVVGSELQTTFAQSAGAASREGRVPAGWLLERAGIRGMRIGNAQSSEHHANYFLNASNATAHDMLALAQEAKARVQVRNGVLLEEEVTIVK